jgi:hypothetical protein
MITTNRRPSMRRMSLPLVLAGAIAALAAGAAEASMCYLVINAKDVLIYRDETTPVDLSDQGAAARDAMRRRGELMMIIDTDQCWPVAAPPSGQVASVDEIVAGIRPAVTSYTAAEAARAGYRGIAAPAVPGGGAPIMGGAPAVVAPRAGFGPATQTIPGGIRQQLQQGRGY